MWHIVTKLGDESVDERTCNSENLTKYLAWHTLKNGETYTYVVRWINV